MSKTEINVVKGHCRKVYKIQSYDNLVVIFYFKSKNSFFKSFPKQKIREIYFGV